MDVLSAAANVLAPAYYALREKGYHVHYDKERDWWIAEKEAIRLVAYNSIELCGLAYVHETKGENWRVSDDDIDEYMSLEE
jgi:hypothetical protein